MNDIKGAAGFRVYGGPDGLRQDKRGEGQASCNLFQIKPLRHRPAKCVRHGTLTEDKISHLRAQNAGRWDRRKALVCSAPIIFQLEHILEYRIATVSSAD